MQECNDLREEKEELLKQLAAAKKDGANWQTAWLESRKTTTKAHECYMALRAVSTRTCLTCPRGQARART